VPGAVEYGRAVKLTGLARGVAQATLEQHVSGRVWEPAARVVPAANGTFSVNVRPLVSTDYRIAWTTKAAAPPVRVAVAPRITLQPTPEPTAMRGLVRPALTGARVDVQRLAGTAWRVVASATVDANGAYEAALNATPGTYRARIAPGRGYVAGVSPVLRVVG